MQIRTVDQNFDYQMHEVFKSLREEYEYDMNAKKSDGEKIDTFSEWLWTNAESFGRAVYDKFDQWGGIDEETEKYNFEK